MDDEEIAELTGICQFTFQGKKRGKGMIEEEAVMNLLLEMSHKDGEDSSDDESHMFVFFRKVFDKLPDKQKHIEHMKTINADFCNSFFDQTDAEMVTMSNIGEEQVKNIYDYLKTIP